MLLTNKQYVALTELLSLAAPLSDFPAVKLLQVIHTFPRAAPSMWLPSVTKVDKRSCTLDAIWLQSSMPMLSFEHLQNIMYCNTL